MQLKALYKMVEIEVVMGFNMVGTLLILAKIVTWHFILNHLRWIPTKEIIKLDKIWKIKKV